MFSEPVFSDFKRLLNDRLQQARQDIGREARKVQSQAALQGSLTNSRYPLLLEEAIEPAFEQALNETMQFLIVMAEKSALPLDQMIEAARTDLVMLLDFCVEAIGRARNAPGMSDVAQRVRERLQQKVRHAEQNVKIGFIGGKSAIVTEAETNQSKALRLLKAIYDTTRGRDEPVFVAELGDTTGLTEPEANAAWRYLRDRALIDTFRIPNTARINGRGVDAIETATRMPDRTSPSFPSVTFNYVNNTVHVGTMTNSSLQQGGVSSTQTATVSNEVADLAELRGVLEHLDAHLADLKLSATDAKRARAQILILQAELESDAKPGVLQQAGKTLRNITEGAIGSLLASGVQDPTVWVAAAALLGRLFG